MLGRVVVRGGRHFLAVRAKDHLGIIAPRGGGVVAIDLGQIGDEVRHKAHDLFGQRAIVRHQPDGRVIAMLGLSHQIRGHDHRIGGGIRQNEAVGRACDHVDADATK